MATSDIVDKPFVSSLTRVALKGVVGRTNFNNGYKYVNNLLHLLGLILKEISLL